MAYAHSIIHPLIRRVSDEKLTPMRKRRRGSVENLRA